MSNIKSPNKPSSVAKSIFYSPLSKPLSVYDYPHSGELYAQEEKRISDDIVSKQAKIGMAINEQNVSKKQNSNSPHQDYNGNTQQNDYQPIQSTQQHKYAEAVRADQEGYSQNHHSKAISNHNQSPPKGTYEGLMTQMLDVSEYRKQQKEIMASETMHQLKSQMEDKEKEKLDEKNKYPMKVQQCLQDDQEIKDWQQKMKYSKMQFQYEYARVLEGQVSDKRHKEIDIRLNNDKRVDEARSKLENSMSGMVPGIYNLASVGSRPIYRTGVMITSNSPMGVSAKYIERLSDEKNERKEKYNTITNQIPQVTQNPYILKEMRKYNPQK